VEGRVKSKYWWVEDLVDSEAKAMGTYLAELKAVGDRRRKFFFVPVLGKMRHLIPWVYFADFIKNRLDGFINALMPGWRKSGKNHDVYRKYRALLSVELQKRGVQSLYSSMLYYIDIIEQLIEELEKRFSEEVVRSVRILLEIFRKTLKFIDEFLKKPLKLSMLRKALFVLRRAFGPLTSWQPSSRTSTATLLARWW
jgi:hypothetical protein